MMVLDSLPSRSMWIIVLILVVGFLRLLESSIENVNEARLQKLAGEKNKAAKKVLFFTENSTKFYSSIKVFNVLAELILASLTVYFLPSMLFPELTPVYAVICTASIVFVLLFIFGVYMPKRLAEIYADEIALKTTYLLYIVYYLGMPASVLLTAISNIFLLIFGIKPDDTDEEVTEEEIRLMVDIGSESGAIDPDEKEMIHNIFELDDTLARDIMTHRTDTEILWIEETDEWDKIIADTNHTVYPVCKENIDNIIGILSSTDYYKARLNNKDITKILKKTYFVPETIKADDLFRDMQRTKNHFAVVMDEYGGISGIITMNDLLEEIVGNLSADSDEPEDDIIKIDENTWKISGSCDIDLVSEALGIELPVEDYNTFAGMIFAELGEIPEDGSTPELETFGLSIKVTKISEHRIESTKVTIIDKPLENE